MLTAGKGALQKKGGQRSIMPKPASGTPVATIAPLHTAHGPTSLMVTSCVTTAVSSTVAAKTAHAHAPPTVAHATIDLTSPVASAPAPPAPTMQPTDILAKAAESIFHVPPAGGGLSPATADGNLLIDTRTTATDVTRAEAQKPVPSKAKARSKNTAQAGEKPVRKRVSKAAKKKEQQQQQAQQQAAAQSFASDFFLPDYSEHLDDNDAENDIADFSDLIRLNATPRTAAVTPITPSLDATATPTEHLSVVTSCVTDNSIMSDSLLTSQATQGSVVHATLAPPASTHHLLNAPCSDVPVTSRVIVLLLLFAVRQGGTQTPRSVFCTKA